MDILNQNEDILTNIFSFFSKDTKQIGILRNVSVLWNNIILKMIENSNNRNLKKNQQNKFIFTKTLYIYLNYELLKNSKDDVIFNKIKNWYSLSKSILNQIKYIKIECNSTNIFLKISQKIVQDHILYFLNNSQNSIDKAETKIIDIPKGFLKNIKNVRVSLECLDGYCIYFIEKEQKYITNENKKTKKELFIQNCQKMLKFFYND